LNLNLSSRKKEYHRRVYSIFQVISSTGGLLDVIERFFALIVLFFSSRMFQINIIKNMFSEEKAKVTAKEDETLNLDHPKVEITLCELLTYQFCIRPCSLCGCSSKLTQKVKLFEKGLKKVEQATDIEQIRKDHRMIMDIKYLLLDDVYLRNLLKIQRRNMIELK